MSVLHCPIARCLDIYQGCEFQGQEGCFLIFFFLTYQHFVQKFWVSPMLGGSVNVKHLVIRQMYWFSSSWRHTMGLALVEQGFFFWDPRSTCIRNRLGGLYKLMMHISHPTLDLLNQGVCMFMSVCMCLGRTCLGICIFGELPRWS